MVARVHDPRAGETGDRPCSERNSSPGFILPAEPPTWGKVRDDMSYRERIVKWCAAKPANPLRKREQQPGVWGDR